VIVAISSPVVVKMTTYNSNSTLRPQTYGFYEGHSLEQADMQVIWSIGANAIEAIENLCKNRFDSELDERSVQILEFNNSNYDWGYRFCDTDGTGFKAAGVFINGFAVLTWWK
jgi:hypothetical protein